MTRALPLALCLFGPLQGCASAPKPTATGIASERVLTTLRNETYAQSERFVDAEAVAGVERIGLPRVAVAEGPRWRRHRTRALPMWTSIWC